MSRSTAGVWKYEDAIQVARRVYKELKPFCDRIDLAGSLRRKEHYVNDIEMLCQPKLTLQPIVVTNKEPLIDLFGESELVKVKKLEEKPARDPEFVKIVHSWECMKGDAVVGRYTQRYLPENIKLDLFIPQAHDYYRMLAIRTGSVNFVKIHVAKRWFERGWRGTEDGLRKIYDCENRNDKWICVSKSPTLPPEWQSEEEFFSWIGLRYVNPENRCLG